MGFVKKILSLPIFLFLFPFFVYVHNVSRSVYAGDVGDLLTAAFLGGVAHPPGYPLFTFLGFVLTHTLVSFSPAFSVGLISAFAGALGVMIFFLLIKKLTKDTLAAFLSANILAWSYLYWFYNEIAEVFALNTFFAIALFFLAIQYKEERKRSTLILFGFVLGLSFTNHQTIILIVPSLLLLLSSCWKDIVKQKLALLYSFLAFLIGMSVYVYVPFASIHHPIVNWDNVHDISSFLHLVLRQDYGTFKAGLIPSANIAQKLVILKTYLFHIATQLTISVVIVSLVGVGVLLKRKWLIGLSFLLGFLLTGPFFILYSGFPLSTSFYIGVYERFFTLSSVMFLFFFPFGLLYITNSLAKLLHREIYAKIFQLLFFLIPFLLFIYNYPKTNLSHVWVGDYVSKDFLNPLPRSAVIFLSGDTGVFNTWYVHYVLHVRPDVQLINLSGISADNFFQKNLEAYKKTAHITEKSKVDLVGETIRFIGKTHPVFSYPQLQPSTGEKMLWMPYGLTFQLLTNENAIPSKEAFLKLNDTILRQLHVITQKDQQDVAFKNLSIAEIPETYANAFLAIGDYFLTQYGDTTLAKNYYTKALAADPANPKNYEILGIYYLSVQRDCIKASDNLQKSIALKPTEPLPYYLLYQTYKNCLKNQNAAKQIVANYNTMFHADFFKDAKTTQTKQ